MLSIRLSRVGKKNKPMYRLAIMEKSKDPYGRALEILGSYNPHSKELQVKADRINHWLENGAQMTPTVNNLLIEQGIVKGEKVKASIARKKKKGGKEKTDKSEKKPANETKSEEKEIKNKKETPIEAKTDDSTVSAQENKEEKPTEENK